MEKSVDPERHKRNISALRMAKLDAFFCSLPSQVLLLTGDWPVMFKHSTGHGVGFAAANPNAIPRIHPASPDLLTEGMTFNIEPAIYFDGYGGMRHCDMVGVGKTGAEVFTNF